MGFLNSGYAKMNYNKQFVLYIVTNVRLLVLKDQCILQVRNWSLSENNRN
jgi:hypothetical protein